MSQGKAKKKLHYHQAEDTSKSQIQIKEVFTLHDIDTLFDDIDADSELRLPMVSPLPKSSGVNDQKESGGSCDSYDMKAPSEQAPKSDLIEVNGLPDDEIIDKESPFKEIAPIKTSSPITLATEGDEEVDGVRPMADPLLFGEDEELIGGDLGQPPCTQQAIHSESLESPPERLEFRKATKPNAGSSSSMKSTSVKATQSTPLEIKEDSPMDKDPSRLSPALVQKNEQKLQGAEQCVDQMVVEVTGKRSSFQHKLKKALMPKSSSSRKPATVPTPPPVDLEEDFMILDDEAPILFVIPRKTDVSKNKKTVQAKTSKESLPEKSPSQTEADVNDQQGTTSKRHKAQKESGKKQPKGNRGKASKMKGKDADLEKITNSVPEVQEEGVGEQISSQNVPGLKDVDSSVVTGEQSSKDRAPDELPDRGEEDSDSPQILAPPVARVKRKSSKSSGSQQERPGSKAKKESKKVKSPHSTNKNRKNSRKGEAVSKTNKGTSKRQVEPEHIYAVCEEDDSVEPPPAYQEEEQAVNKQSSNKQDALKDPKKAKTKETKRIEPTPKDPPPVASDTSSDSSMMSKRMRKPPGTWWLTDQDEGATQGESEETGGIAKGPKSKKPPSKQATVDVSEEAQSSKPAQKRHKRKSSSTFNVVENAKKVLTEGDDAKAEQRTAKKSGGRKKIKAAAQPQVPSPTRVSEEEVGATSEVAAEDISPVFCTHRRHNPIPVEKQLFNNVYTRDNGTAKKRPSSSLRRPESSTPDVPWKRQRRAPSNWWEVEQSPEPTDGPFSRHTLPPQKSKPTNVPSPAVLNIEPNPAKSLKKNHMRNGQRNIISTPKSIKRSLASMNAIFASDKVNVVKSGQRRRKQGRRNILHSLEDQSDHSSENMAHSDDQMQGNRHVTSRFVAVKPSGKKTQTSVRVSSGPNTLSDIDVAFRSGPSSMIELQHHDEEDEDIDLPSTRLTPRVQRVPRVLSQCDLCGPPLQTIVLEEEDWNNLKAWFSHLWPPASKEGRVISPDDFHWHSYGGRAMGHVVDLQSTAFSHGKILLGSFMKKPPQMDPETVSVFSIISSCVRVEIDGVKSVYNSGQVFMISSGRVYSIHNLCQEPAVLIYHRTQSDNTQC